MSNKISYTAAFQELQDIVSALEDGDIALDSLSEKVKRAGVLIAICKEKLSTTEEDVSQIIKELSAKESPEILD